jgi:hypothetical protein
MAHGLFKFDVLIIDIFYSLLYSLNGAHHI